MESNQEDWTKATDPDIGEAVEQFKEAQKVNGLLQAITLYASAAVKHAKLDRDWANAWLSRLGADPVGGGANYQINVPIAGHYGATVHANSRVEALTKFEQARAAVASAGEVRGSAYCQGVFGVEFVGGDPVFFSGPQDPTLPTGSVPGYDALRSDIRAMIKQGVAEKGWGHSYAVAALDEMGLEPLPNLVYRNVQVPVSGVAQVSVPVFEDADDAAVQAAAVGAMLRSDTVGVKPDEIGAVLAPRSGDMGLNLVDEDPF